jgi:hypothetical protein|nr:hypothetical protein [Caballeronia sp. INML1]
MKCRVGDTYAPTLRNPAFKFADLPLRLGFDPVRIVEHEDIGLRNGAARRARWDRRIEAKAVIIDDGRYVVRGPGLLRTLVDTLQPVDGPVAFRDPLIRETGFLKLPVNVARENERALALRRSPFTQDVEATVWVSLAIQIESMP